MDSERERPRVPTTSVNGGDRISSLPDAILSHILSFLPSTEDSVRTRSLSSRWKHLFSLVPVLVFAYPRVSYSSSSSDSDSSDRNSSSPVDSGPDRTLDFLDFVDWVFNSYNVQKMERFSFHVSGTHPENARILSWISESLRRGVKELYIDVSFNEPQTAPREIFACETIASLSIHSHVDGNFVLDVPEDVILPNLKKLVLWGLSFLDDASLRRLFRGCVVLEELSHKWSECEHIECVDICIPSLKTITIIHGPENTLDFVLNLPNIENFCYNGGYIDYPSFSFQGFKLLVEANIGYEDVYIVEQCEAFQKLINVVCNARELVLSWHTLEIFQSRFSSYLSYPMFCNLTHLTISDISCDCLDCILDLLDRTPRLQILELHNIDSYIDYDDVSDGFDFSSARVPACVSLSLKEVIFEGFLTLDNEFAFVEYLLKNAKVLDLLNIVSSGSLRNQFEMTKKLLTFSKWSRTCRVVVYPYICRK